MKGEVRKNANFLKINKLGVLIRYGGLEEMEKLIGVWEFIWHRRVSPSSFLLCYFFISSLLFFHFVFAIFSFRLCYFFISSLLFFHVVFAIFSFRLCYFFISSLLV